MQGKTGVARLTLATDVPVLPLAVWGSHNVWRRGGIKSLAFGRPYPHGREKRLAGSQLMGVVERQRRMLAPGEDLAIWSIRLQGKGFKHGPAVGSHVAELVAGTAKPREPFLLAAKQRQQERAVQ